MRNLDIRPARNFPVLEDRMSNVSMALPAPSHR